MSLYSLNTLFTKKSSLFDSIKALEIKTIMVFNLSFLQKYYFMMFFFFLINYLLIHFISHVFNSTTRLAILVEIPTKEAKAEIAIHSVIAKISE